MSDSEEKERVSSAQQIPGGPGNVENVFGPDDEAIREKRERVEIIDLLRANLN